MLEIINSPADIKALSSEELNKLCGEIREKIISTVSVNGGHLASNLGMVEATLAIHRVFDSPRDTVIFDVGHQCYAHKLITGRAERFDELRKYTGLSGFTSPTESPHDAFYAGHCGTSISEGLGVANAKKLMGDDSFTVCIVGDGAFTNGMIYEALNNCTDKSLRLIIILNDNEMSISKNVGKVSASLSEFRTSQSYFSFKHKLKRGLLKIPLIGKRIKNFLTKFRDLIRRMLVKDNLFETLGLEYLGPVDGNDIEKLETVLCEAKRKSELCIVHMTTEKGHGYDPARLDPTNFHSTSAFDPVSGLKPAASMSFSSVFGDIMVDSAKYDERVCGITAAMCEGTGLSEFSKLYPERFFDVGIAEEHAVTFTGGLAKRGLKPVCAIYSTFFQRCYDQLFHDIALQNVNAVFALDRSGFVDDDGPTHQGLYDVAMASSIPGADIYSPETYEEMEICFEKAFSDTGVNIVRYPKGKQAEYDRSGFAYINETLAVCDIDAELTAKKSSGNKEPELVCIITYGRVTKNVYEAALELKKTCAVKIIKLLKIYPLDYIELFALCKGAKQLCFVEEGVRSGGIAEKTAATFALSDLCKTSKYHYLTAPDGFMPVGKTDMLYKFCGLDSENIAAEIRNKLNTK